jgi:hypothetical protein
MIFQTFSDTGFATHKAQRWHRAFLTAHHQGMQKKDDAKFFKKMCLILCCKDLVVTAGFK